MPTKAAQALTAHNIFGSLYHLAKDILGYSDLDPGLHHELCMALQAQAERKLILLPRGHFKTTLCTVSYPIWRVVKDPNIRIALVSATQTNAIAFLREIKGQLLGNKDLRVTFPQIVPSSGQRQKWSSTEIAVNRTRLHKESTIEAVGIGGNLVGKHFDLIIYDDVVTVENAATAEQRMKLHDWYRHSLSLLEPGGEALVVGTRYHYHDLYGQLAAGGLYKTLVRSALENGRPIFPTRFPAKRLDKLREEQGSYIFSCQYLNEPVDDERAIFRRSWLRFIRPDQMPPNLLYFITVDPAIGDTAGSDYTAIVTCGMDREGNLYVVDMVREHLSPHGLIEEIFRVNERWKPVRIGIEAVGFQATLVHFINREMLERGIRLPLVPIKRQSGESKLLRILALQPAFERGQLFVVDGCPQADALEEELVRFPRGATDDLLDALADQLRIAFPPIDTDGVHLSGRQGRHHRTGY